MEMTVFTVNIIRNLRSVFATDIRCKLADIAAAQARAIRFGREILADYPDCHAYITRTDCVDWHTHVITL